jgi:hypothetical protein
VILQLINLGIDIQPMGFKKILLIAFLTSASEKSSGQNSKQKDNVAGFVTKSFFDNKANNYRSFCCIGGLFDYF